MENEKLLTISQLAKITGKSRQYIYSLLDNKLSTYIQVYNDVKHVKSQCLSEVFGIDVDANLLDSKVNKSVKFTVPDSKVSSENILLKDKIIDELKADKIQLQAEITKLHEQLSVKDKQIDQLNILLSQQQQLLALHMKQIQTKEEPEPEQPQEHENATIVEPQKQEEPKTNKSFWDLFRNKHK